MAERQRRGDVRLYLPHALAATLAVVVLPAAIVFAVVWSGEPPMYVTLILGIALSLIAASIGGALWKRRPASVDISFGELMIWGWYRRKRAEERLAQGEHLLGIDRQEDLPRVVRVDSEQQLAILRDLTRALESKDPYTHGHSRRVEQHTVRTGNAMGLSHPDLADLSKAASLHDVGKIRVPDRILRKEGMLTVEERVVLEDHVLVGAWMVSSVGNTDVVLGVRHHHERWDGSGYPNGLVGTEIPLLARIVAVADAFDAMTSSRPYRASLGREHALDVLRDEAGRQFDPIVVEAFVSTLPARVPVAAFLPLLAAPQRLIRELAASFTRVGAGSVASAVGAAGVAAVIGAASFSPSADRPKERDPVVSVDSNGQDGDTDGSGSTGPADRDRGVKVALEEPNGDEDQRPRDEVLASDLERGLGEPAVGPADEEQGDDKIPPEPQPGKDEDDDPEADGDDDEPEPDDDKPEPQPGKDDDDEPVVDVDETGDTGNTGTGRSVGTGTTGTEASVAGTGTRKPSRDTGTGGSIGTATSIGAGHVHGGGHVNGHGHGNGKALGHAKGHGATKLPTTSHGNGHAYGHAKGHGNANGHGKKGHAKK